MGPGGARGSHTVGDPSRNGGTLTRVGIAGLCRAPLRYPEFVFSAPLRDWVLFLQTMLAENSIRG